MNAQGKGRHLPDFMNGPLSPAGFEEPGLEMVGAIVVGDAEPVIGDGRWFNADSLLESGLRVLGQVRS